MARRTRDDSGFTLVEMAVAMLIGSSMMVGLLGMLSAHTSAERRVATLTDNQESARLALVEFQRDLRSAATVLELPAAADYAAKVRLQRIDFATDASSVVQWRVDTAAKELVREDLDASGAVTATTYRLAGVVDTAPFRYFGQDGAEFTLTGANAVAPSRVSDCTVRMAVTLHAAPGRGPAPTLVDSDVELRNLRPGKLWCP